MKLNPIVFENTGSYLSNHKYYPDDQLELLQRGDWVYDIDMTGDVIVQIIIHNKAGEIIAIVVSHPSVSQIRVPVKQFQTSYLPIPDQIEPVRMRVGVRVRNMTNGNMATILKVDHVAVGQEKRSPFVGSVVVAYDDSAGNHGITRTYNMQAFRRNFRLASRYD